MLLPMTVGGILSLAGSLMLVQLVKRILGIVTEQELDKDGGWTSADHLSYYNSEKPDEQTGQWPLEQWPGSLSGRGQNQQNSWKRGD